ncbi:hypothetical protein BDZ97DRAFT_1670344 [Flammula alnicola]|nr:hypothetical protein BDZ97DRAFT_1670344 [Flammula alnicola]
MNACSPIRAFLYMCFFVFSVVLLGLTGARIRHTETLGDGGDILTTRTGFYDPVIVEILVTSALAILASLWLMTAILARIGGPMGKFATEHVMLWPIWIMFLVGGAVATHKWHNLKWCRGAHKECRILESIKAFVWICWGWLTIILIASVIHMITNKHGIGGPLHGEQDTGTYPETRETRTTTTAVENRPVAPATAEVA